MLVLSRKPGEKILIGDSVTVTIVRIGTNTVRIGIDAPREISIVREELIVEVSPGQTLTDDEIVEQVRESIEISHLESE